MKIKKHNYLFISLATSLFITACADKDVYNPDRVHPVAPVENPLGEDFVAPDGFDWSMITTVNLNVGVKDEFNGQYKYLVEVFNTNPLSDGTASPLAAGYAKAGSNYIGEISIPKSCKQIFIRQTDPKQRKEVYQYTIPENGGTLNCKLYYTATTTRTETTGSTSAYEAAKQAGIVDPEAPNYKDEINVPSKSDTPANEWSSGMIFDNGAKYIITEDYTETSPFIKDIQVNGRMSIYVKGTWKISAINYAFDIYILDGGKIISDYGLTLDNKPNLTIASKGLLSVKGIFSFQCNKTINFGTIKAESLNNPGSANGGEFYNSGILLQELEKVSTLNQSIMEREIFTSTQSQENNPKLYEDKIKLQKAEENISHLSDNLNEYNFSKEGVGINDMVIAWLTSCIDEAKAKAQLQVLLNRQKTIFDQYSHMSPIGTQVNRKQRAINIAEDNYRTQLKGLADANLRLKNIEMGTSNLQTVSPPDYPLTDNGRKRMIYVLIAFIGSIVFIVTYFLLIELLDRTLRDPLRSKRLSGLPVIAAFNGTSNLKFRGFLKTCNRLAAAYSCRQMNKYLQKERPTIINLLSMESGEGKSYLAKYFVDYWETEGIKTRIVMHGVDFDVEAKEYVNAQQLSSFWRRNEAEQEPDIILVEYPAINNASIPLDTLRQADVNLLVANACRLWRNSDNATLQPIKEAMENVPFFLYLNNADREVVESFTGELPPRTPLHSFVSRLAQLGLTSKKAAVK